MLEKLTLQVKFEFICIILKLNHKTGVREIPNFTVPHQLTLRSQLCGITVCAWCTWVLEGELCAEWAVEACRTVHWVYDASGVTQLIRVAVFTSGAWVTDGLTNIRCIVT